MNKHPSVHVVYQVLRGIGLQMQSQARSAEMEPFPFGLEFQNQQILWRILKATESFFFFKFACKIEVKRGLETSPPAIELWSLVLKLLCVYV